MRPILSRLSEIYNRHARVSFASSGTGAPSESAGWRERAIRETTLVRRVLRGAQSGGAAAAGPADTVHALEVGTVRELLLTRHFLDSQPSAADNVLTLARAAGIATTVLAGVGAFELDMVAGGVGALLRRPLNAVGVHAHV